MNTTEIKANAIIQALIQQRNQMADNVAQMAGELALLQAKVDELTKQEEQDNG